MRKSVLALFIIPLISHSQESGPGGKAQPAKASWQTSWQELVNHMEDIRQSEPGSIPPLNEGFFAGFLLDTGGPVLPKSAKRKGQMNVGWELELDAIFQGLERTADSVRALQDSETVLKLELPDTAPRAIVFVYPNASVIGKWRAIPINRRVRFRAWLEVLAVAEFPNTMYVATLKGAEPVQ